MHESSFEKMRAALRVYAPQGPGPWRVLDVGSGGDEGTLTYRSLVSPPRFTYVGLDIDAGPNVDVVVRDPYDWREVADESVDLVLSGQMLEHSPYFWISAAEIARVLVPGGTAILIAPSTGYPHRFPLDCWRFYPDSWPALCSYVGLELVESYREQPSWRKVIPGTHWRDAMMVARKPVLTDAGERARQGRRLCAIVETRAAMPAPAGPLNALGPAGRRYEAAHSLSAYRVVWRPAAVAALVQKGFRRLQAQPGPARLRRLVWDHDGRTSRERGQARIGWPEPPEPPEPPESPEHQAAGGAPDPAPLAQHQPR